MTTEKDADRSTRKRRKEARPGELIEAGLKEFAEKGFAATRLEDVAKRAGVAKGTIYRYFESKEALFEAAVRSRIAPVMLDAERLVDASAESAETLLRQVIEIAYAQVLATDAIVLARILVAEGGRFPDLLAMHHREVIQKGQALIGKIIARGVASGEFRASAATELPMIAFGPAVMAAIWRLTFDALQPIPLERFRDAHIALALDGLKAS